MSTQLSFEHFFTTQLNPQQQTIVAQKDGVLLVCAGAGSGKTRIITARMTNLILTHTIQPHSIVALTFTNKAAREMKERMLTFLGSQSRVPSVGTFHSYCLRLLKAHSNLIRIPEFSIIDSDDQEKLLKQILHKHGVHKKITPKQVLSIISSLKNEAVSGNIPWELVPDHFMRTLIATYEREKTQAHCFDFDDLLLETLRLFLHNPEFKKQYQTYVRHLLVDEYQDTNKVQHALLQAMTCDENKAFALDSLCVVGDEDQSIYSWRGATIQNIVYFKKDFPEVASHTIEQNYRSAQHILDVANDIISHNRERNPKKLWSNKKAYDRVRILSCSSGYQEADLVIAYAQKYRNQFPDHSLALLYRSHYQSRLLEEALLKQNIPYKIIGGIHFYDRLEIKDLLAYLRLFANPYDRISFSRVYNTPARGLGEKFLEQFFELWDQRPFSSFIDVAHELISLNLVTGAKARSFEAFLGLFKNLTLHDRPSTALTTIINTTQYGAYLENAFEEDEASAKLENIKELLSAITSLEDREPATTIRSFLDEVALLQDAMAEQDKEQSCVQLMTLHAAKGLEFDGVIITGLEEQVLPSAHALASGNIEEERRLLYVGATRARERLLLSHARYRHTYGSMTEHRRSRFLEEIEPNLITSHDASNWSFSHISLFTSQWFSSLGTPSKPQPPAAQRTSLSWHDDPFDAPTNSLWKVHQRVNHDVFGAGTIESIETKGPETTYLTIKFGTVRKKIDARFVQSN